MKDIDQIRRENMSLLEAKAGGATQAAALYGCSQSQWSNWRLGARDSRTGKQRGMRKETARSIERAFGVPVGWLDEDHGLDAADLVQPRVLTHDQQTMLRLVDRLTMTQRQELIRMLEQRIQENNELLAELARLKK